jgi:hypothetical protein
MVLQKKSNMAKKHHQLLWDIEGSSNIAQISWESKREQLIVLFHNGSQYLYDGVPKKLAEEVATAESVGKAFNQLIKPRYEGVKI